MRALVGEFCLDGTSLGHEIVELWFFQGCLDLARTFLDTEPALLELSQVYKLGVITNGLEYRQQAKFESLAFTNFLTSSFRAKQLAWKSPLEKYLNLG